MSKNQTKSRLPFLEDFLLYIQANNYSRETLYNYERDLISRARKTANGAVAQKELKSGSINRTLTSLRRYLAYLIDMNTVTPIAPESIKLLRMEKNHPQVSELAELVKLI